MRFFGIKRFPKKKPLEKTTHVREAVRSSGKMQTFTERGRLLRRVGASTFHTLVAHQSYMAQENYGLVSRRKVKRS